MATTPVCRPRASFPRTFHDSELEAGARLGQSQQTQRQKIIDSTKVDVRKSGALLYAIGIGTRRGAPVNTVLLESLTTESGGYVEPLRDPAEISAAVVRICDDLQSQYLLAFEPGPTDGSYHAIRVRTKDRQLRVRARAGYVAPSTAPK